MIMDDYQMVVAIDIGNSYSGFAYGLKEDYEIQPLKILTENWMTDSKILSISQKTLTAALFDIDRQLHSFGYEAKDKYLELVQEEEQKEWYYFSNFRKQLFKGEPLTNKVKVKSIDGKEMVALDVFSAVIKFLKCRLLDEFDKRKLPIRKNEIKWVLTMPATGDLYAKHFIREATQKAGIAAEHMLIVLEPDAALLYCRYLYMEKGESERGLRGFAELSNGGKCLIVDCGEDTVDITVHEVLPDLKLRLLQTATGRAWGEAQVDETFKQLLIKIFGAPVYTKFSRLYKFEHTKFWEEFEVKKRTILCNDKETNDKITMHFPCDLLQMFEDDTGEDIEESIENTSYSGKVKVVGDKFRFEAEVFQSLFEESGGQIVNHVKELLEISEVSGCSTFIMIGRLSECPMIQHIVGKTFPNVRVITPPDAGLATLLGAVLSGWQTIKNNRFPD